MNRPIKQLELIATTVAVAEPPCAPHSAVASERAPRRTCQVEARRWRA